MGKSIRNLPSKAFELWAKAAMIELKANYKPIEFDYPVYVHYKIYRETKRKCDLSNLIEGPNDLLQQAGLIDDDDFKHLIPIFYSEFAGLGFDKENPRIVITLTDRNFNLTKQRGC